MKKLLTILVLGAVLVVSCKKDEEKDDTVTVAPSLPGYYTTEFSVGGASYKFVDGETGTYGQEAGLMVRGNRKYTIISPTDTITDSVVTVKAMYVMAFTAKNTKQKIVFRTDTLTHTDSNNFERNRPAGAAFYAFISRSNIAIANNGARIIYTDENGETWSSAAGAQSGASFSLVSNETGVYASGIEFGKVTLSATCVVYKVADPSASQTLTITSMKGPLANSN